MVVDTPREVEPETSVQRATPVADDVAFEASLRTPLTTADPPDTVTYPKITSSIKLDSKGDLYMPWASSIQSILRTSPDLWAVVDGSLVPPQDPDTDAKKKQKARYDKANPIAIAVIINSLEPVIITSLFRGMDQATVSAQGIWTAIKDYAVKRSGASSQTAFTKFTSMHFSPEKPIDEGIAEFDKLVGIIRMSDNAVGDKFLMSRLLDALPRNWGPFKSSINIDDMNYNGLKERVLEEGIRRQNDTSKADYTTAYVAHQSRKPARQYKPNPCGPQGPAFGAGASWQSKVTCYSCGKIGHLANQCRTKPPKKKPQKPRGGGQGNAHAAEYPEALATAPMSISQADDTVWIIDSGCNKCVCNDLSLFSEYTPYYGENDSLYLAGGKPLKVTGKGIVTINVENDLNQVIPLTFQDVLYVKAARRCLVGENQLIELGWKIISDREGKHIMHETMTELGHLVVNTTGGLPCFRTVNADAVPDIGEEANENAQLAALAAEDSSGLDKPNLTEIHNLLGHLSHGKIESFLRREGVEYTRADTQPCDTCTQTKMTRVSFRTKPMRGRATVLGHIHFDLCDPGTMTLGKTRYLLALTDEFSKYRKLYFLKNKSDTTEAISDFCKWWQTQTGTNVKSFKMDGAKENTSEEMREVMRKVGASIIVVPPYSPASDGMAERGFRTILGLARAMLLHAKLPDYLWGEASNHAATVLNIVTTNPTTGLSPYEMVLGRKPPISKLRAFGEHCFYYKTGPGNLRKLETRSELGIHVGTESFVDSYRIYDPEKRSVRRTKDVKFRRPGMLRANQPDSPPEDQPQTGQPQQSESGESTSHQIAQPDEAEASSGGEPTPEDSASGRVDRSAEEQPDTPDCEPVHGTGRVLRDRKKLKKPERYEALTGIDEPQSRQEALSSPQAREWAIAMDEEWKNMLKYKVFRSVPLPPGRRAIGVRWAFRQKKNELGEVVRFKARICPKGYAQKYGVNYLETCAPVGKAETLRVLFAIAAQRKYYMQQVDIEAAYLTATLCDGEKLFTEQVDGYEDNSSNVLELLRPLYGTKQGAYCFYNKLSGDLKALNLTPSQYDPCLYTKINQDEFLAVFTHTDDIAIFASNEELINQTTAGLQRFYTVKTDRLRFYLGIRVTQFDNGDVHLDQEAYINELLDRYELRGCKAAATPMDVNLYDDCGEPTDKPLRAILGGLQYIATATRPDIQFSVNHLSRFQQNPSKSHWTRATRILKYLSGTATHGILFKNRQPHTGADGDPQLDCYSDSDWASDPITRRSIAGGVLSLNGAAVVWFAQQQKSVAISSCEAEIYAASLCAQSALWLRRLLEELNINIVPCIQIDNTGAIELASKSIYRKRSRHIAVRELFIRQQVLENNLTVKHVGTEDQLGDQFTKVLPKPRFIKLRESIGITQRPSQA